ncbi:MAG: hypothetical protein ACRELY_17590, partial [Polyangiaceae bacterium]
MRRIVFVAIALLAGGCSLFVDLDGLDARDAGGSDALAPDATPNEAAASDAGDSGNADASHFTCPDASLVCDDFDESPLGARWSAVTVQNGTLAIDDAEWFSPPNSLLITLPDNSGGLLRYNRLELDVSDLPSIDCQFEVRLDATDSTDGSDVDLWDLVLSPPGFDSWVMDIT